MILACCGRNPHGRPIDARTPTPLDGRAVTISRPDFCRVEVPWPPPDIGSAVHAAHIFHMESEMSPTSPDSAAARLQGHAEVRARVERLGAFYLRDIRVVNGARRIFVHSDRRCATPGEELNSFSARSRLSSISALCMGRKKSGQVSFAVPLGDMESSCRSSVELFVTLVAVKEWCPLKPDGPVN